METLQLLQVQSEMLQRPKPRKTERTPFPIPTTHSHPHIFWTHPGSLCALVDVKSVGALDFPEGLAQHHPSLSSPFPRASTFHTLLNSTGPSGLGNSRNRTWDTLFWVSRLLPTPTIPLLYQGLLWVWPHMACAESIPWYQLVTCESKTLSRCSHH